jgi:catechol 2,3-dioxygenase-like lactoylglutathione lyase family enzyme
MHLIQEMGYVAYGVRDLDRAVDFYRNVCQLEVTGSQDGAVFLTGDTRHHWVRLEQRGESGLLRLGYQAVDRAALEEITRRLDRLGVAWTAVADSSRGPVRGAVRFRSPDGIDFEIYERMLRLPASPAPERGISCLLHAVVFVSDVSRSRDFYTEALGMLVSDQIEEVVTFLRCGNFYHHALALARGEAGRLDHVAMLVEDVEDVLAFRAHAKLHSALGGDVVKHVASNSVSVYLNHAPEGIGVEFANGHGVITDDRYSGRLIKAGPTTVNAWAAGFPVRPLPDPVVALPAPAADGTAAASAASATEVEYAVETQ